jgi:hypothetical protein
MYSEQVHLAVEGLEGSLTTDFDGLRIYPRLTTFPSLCQCVSSIYFDMRRFYFGMRRFCFEMR